MRDYLPKWRAANTTPESERERLKALREANPERTRANSRKASMRYYRRHGPKSITKYPERHRARQAVGLALRQGVMTKEPCRVCAAPAEAHHHLGWDREHWLDVQWLCKPHHVEAHKAA